MHGEMFSVRSALIVDDDQESAARVAHYLDVLGYEDIHCSTPGNARAATVDIALVCVTDVATFQLATVLAAKGAKVIFMSSWNTLDIACGAQGFSYVEKPLSLPRLKAVLERALIAQAEKSEFAEDKVHYLPHR